VELDGHRFHHDNKNQVDADNARARDLTAKGWIVIRFSGRQVNANEAGCVSEAMSTVARLASGRPPSSTSRTDFESETKNKILTPEELAAAANDLLKALEAQG
jgi:hypothetical protein